MAEFALPMGLDDIMRVLPHRPPFLYVDAVEELEVGKHVVGTLRVDPDWPLFEGNFPSHPVMPGVLILEAMAQVGAIPVLARDDMAGRIPFFAGADDVRFKQPVFPGDVLRLEVEIARMRGVIGWGNGVVSRDGVVVATGTVIFAMKEPNG